MFIVICVYAPMLSPRYSLYVISYSLSVCSIVNVALNISSLYSRAMRSGIVDVSKHALYLYLYRSGIVEVSKHDLYWLTALSALLPAR